MIIKNFRTICLEYSLSKQNLHLKSCIIWNNHWNFFKSQSKNCFLLNPCVWFLKSFYHFPMSKNSVFLYFRRFFTWPPFYTKNFYHPKILSSWSENLNFLVSKTFAQKLYIGLKGWEKLSLNFIQSLKAYHFVKFSTVNLLKPLHNLKRNFVPKGRT